MNRAIRAVLTVAAAAAAATVISGPIAAHSGEWGLFLDAERSSPGGSLHLRGDLPSTGPIQLVLVGADPAGLLLTTVDDAPNGHFEAFVTFPSNVAPGTWTVEARAAGMPPARASLELLAGSPPEQGEGSEAAPQATAQTITAAPLAPLPDPVPSAVGVDLVPLAAGVLAVTALGVLLLRTRRATAGR